MKVILIALMVLAVVFAVPIHAVPHPFVTQVTFVSAIGGSSGGSDVQAVTAVVTGATSGDMLLALTSEDVAGAPTVQDSLGSFWFQNVTVTGVDGFTVSLWVANLTSTASDTVYFNDSGAGAVMEAVWELNDTAGFIGHASVVTTSTTSAATSVQVDSTNGFIGIWAVATRATGGTSNAVDPALSYDSAGSCSTSVCHDGLWMQAPLNGTGVLPVDIGVNASTAISAFSFYVPPASNGIPPTLVASIASFGPSTCEPAGCTRVLFNGTATGGTTPYTFTWNWGDGSSNTVDTGNATGSDRTKHLFVNGAGYHQVRLTVTDAALATSSDFVNVTEVRNLLAGLTMNLTSPCIAAVGTNRSVTFNTSVSYGLPNYSAEYLLLNSTGAVMDVAFGNSSSSAFFNASQVEVLPIDHYHAWMNVTDSNAVASSASVVLIVTSNIPSTVPAAPTDLTVTGTNTTNVSLTWTNPGGGGLVQVTLYQGLTCGNWSVVKNLTSVVTAFVVENLTPNTAICFAVSAWNATGQSGLSTPVNTTTNATGGGGGGAVVVAPIPLATLTFWLLVLAGGIIILGVLIAEYGRRQR